MKLHKVRDQRGVAAGEAALTITVFVVLLFGIMESGRVLSFQQTLTDAARVGAQLAATDARSSNPDPSAVESGVREFLRNSEITAESISIEPAVVEPDGVYTRVSVSAPHNVINLAPLFDDWQIMLTGSSQVRNARR